MNDELKKAVQKSHVVMQEAHTEKRLKFKSLLLTNPNYFGNLLESEFTPVFPISGNTYYEELGCVGYHPQQKTLEAVVYIYQPSGYGTDICGPGTPEYVRFYLSFDNGATWQDQGLTSFQVYNIPEGTEGGKRLEYAASLKVDPKPKYCIYDPLIKARAILSWNDPPPANQPNWPPVWGNVRETSVLVEPWRIIYPLDIFEIAKVKIPPVLKEVIDLDTPIPTKKKALKAADLADLYKGKGVPVHRFAFKELSAYVSAKTNISAESFNKKLPGVEIDPNIFDILFPKTDGDISYEELKCIGLDPNFPDTLVGVIHVKKSAGYSGGPCTDGSREYVTFWADFDGSGSFETCLGTADVRVYDLSGIPAGGVYYAVRLPVDLSQYRQACKVGAKVVSIRAILSWNTAVPCNQPNHVPTWGNREETLINIAPSAQAPAGQIAILGNVATQYIDDATGLTTPGSIFSDNNLPTDSLGRPCPFGGRINVKGWPLLGYSYKVEVTPVTDDDGNPIVSAPATVVTNLTLTRQDGTTYVHTADPGTGRFTYRPGNENIENLLALWDSAGNAKWEVKLTTYDPLNNLAGTDTHLIQLDNTGLAVSIDITTGVGNCGKFVSGTPLAGKFVARDKYLDSYTIYIEPDGVLNPHVAIPGTMPVDFVSVPKPSSGNANTAVAPGDDWTLNTMNMVSCGYIIRVYAEDRAIVDSGHGGHVASDSAGFCLEVEEE